MADPGGVSDPGPGPVRRSLELWRAVARRMGGPDYAHHYAERFDQLAASGQDMHGEATFVTSLLAPGAAVLDAGCGTGRVGQRLAELGFDVAGVDIDEAMVAVARERFPAVPWHVQDLAALDLPRRFDAVVAAGNVVPFVPLSDLDEVARRLAAHLVDGGLLVAGFGFDEAHLPPGAPTVPLPAYDAACAAAGLRLVDRFAGWAREEPTPEAGYAVSVHRRE